MLRRAGPRSRTKPKRKAGLSGELPVWVSAFVRPGGNGERSFWSRSPALATGYFDRDGFDQLRLLRGEHPQLLRQGKIERADVGQPQRPDRDVSIMAKANEYGVLALIFLVAKH